MCWIILPMLIAVFSICYMFNDLKPLKRPLWQKIYPFVFLVKWKLPEKC